MLYALVHVRFYRIDAILIRLQRRTPVLYGELRFINHGELQIAPVCTALGLPILAGKFLAGGIFQRHRRVGVYDDVRR